MATMLLQASASSVVVTGTSGHVSSSINAGRVNSVSYSGLRAVPSVSLRSAAARRVPSRSSSGVRCEAKETAVESAAGVVTDGTFKELVLQSKLPVLVDFWAPWCGPCRMIAPLIDELSIQYKEKLVCLKLNTDDSPGVATEYGIRSIPTVMIFKNGKKMDTVIGAVPKTTLTSTVEKYLD